MTTIRSVAIVGAGQMGAGIAQAVAAGGYEVILYDAVSERVPEARAVIAASLARHVGRGMTGTNRACPVLREASSVCRQGDTLLVTNLDCLARFLRHASDMAAGRADQQ